MPNSIIHKIEQEIAGNRRKMMIELEEACAHQQDVVFRDGSVENWKLYQQAWFNYYKAISSKQDDDMFLLLNRSIRHKQSRKSVSSSI
jgi:hypothetical protein